MPQSLPNYSLKALLLEAVAIKFAIKFQFLPITLLRLEVSLETGSGFREL